MGLHTVPTIVATIPSLLELQLWNNKIKELPKEMKYLVTLHELSVVDNELEFLGSEIGYDPNPEIKPEIGYRSPEPKAWKPKPYTISNKPQSQYPKLETRNPEPGTRNPERKTRFMSSLTSLKLTKNHLKTLPTEIGSLVNLVVFKVSGTISGGGAGTVCVFFSVAKAFDEAPPSSGGLVQLACFG